MDKQCSAPSNLASVFQKSEVKRLPQSLTICSGTLCSFMVSHNKRLVNLLLVSVFLVRV